MNQNSEPGPTEKGIPTNLFQSLAIVLVLFLSICTAVLMYKDSATAGPIQLALIFTAFVSILVGFKNGIQWKTMEMEIAGSVGIAANAIFILISVGALIGTWIICGTVPAMIYYGLQLLSPVIFYPTACLICAFVSLSIGSSWTTIATVGIALLGISQALGLPAPITVGAIISGAYFGDKMSPLSDTTNLAPAVAGSEIFSHIRHMTWVSIPSFILALLLYTLIGLALPHTETDAISLASFTDTLNSRFAIGLHLLIPLAVLLYMAIKRIPAMPTIFFGALLGGLFAILFQPDVVTSFVNRPDENQIMQLIQGVSRSMFSGYEASTGNTAIDSLLSKGGMQSMLQTVWLILSAMLMAGILNCIGVLQRVVRSLLLMTKNTGALIATTLANCVLVNLLAAEQYISIIIPGQIWREEYRRRGLAAINLSRCLEDAGTLSSPLIPWTTCGAYIFGVLGLTSFAYIPFCFFNIINPVISAIYGYTGFTIAKYDGPEEQPV